MNIKAINAQCILSVSGGRWRYNHEYKPKVCESEHLDNIAILIEGVSAVLDKFRDALDMSPETANSIVSIVMEKHAPSTAEYAGIRQCICKKLSNPVRIGLGPMCK